MLVFDDYNTLDQLLATSGEAYLNTSCNMSMTVDDNGKYPDAFTRALAEEGFLSYSNPISNMPVLSVCHGFLNTELAVANLSTQDEMRYRSSLQQLPRDKHENYIRLFSAQYPTEPVVDGLPGSVWLECVEPTLSILKALNALKRRKSNLSIRKCSMVAADSNVASRGDFEHVPHLFNHFVYGLHHRLMRIQLLALEGAHSIQSRNNQNSLHEVQEGRYTIQPNLRTSDGQRRRRLRQYRPYDTHQELLRGSHDLDNGYGLEEIINNYEYNEVDFVGI